MSQYTGEGIVTQKQSALAALKNQDATFFENEERLELLHKDLMMQAMTVAIETTNQICDKKPQFNDNLSIQNSKMLMLIIFKALYLYLLLRHIELQTTESIYQRLQVKVNKMYNTEYQDLVSTMAMVSRRANICHSSWFNPLKHLDNSLKPDESGKLQGSPFKMIAKIIVINFFDERHHDRGKDLIEQTSHQIALQLLRSLK